jgi:thymidylate kinase
VHPLATAGSYSPLLIAITGIDGCGKSTQVKMMSERLSVEGWDAVPLWTGGKKTLSRPLVRAGQLLLRAPRRGRDRRFYARDVARQSLSQEFSAYLGSSHRLFHHGMLRHAWTDLALVEHALEIAVSVTPHLCRGRAVVCDRYIFRTIVNLAVLLDLPAAELTRLLRHPALRLIPRPAVYVLLDVPAEVGFARKQDLPSLEYVARRVPIYRRIAAMTRMPVIDATQSPQIIHERIWDIVNKAVAGCDAGWPT